ncbi:phosphatidate cytidylyltransferase [Sphingomonas sp. JC676]|uniref:phosphatidate cytidylyltransferase n=1 Tax=Sphingomonas sp. JC676 TaxID=2768065 RepID=UPI001657D8E5|nr:phosphatidate cytidylyltransferase [Sphingomonas sp. JC676]MBC9031764.1 phosphatidate cytidylyltransferase [Sphingomonas sp. JC676]
MSKNSDLGTRLVVAIVLIGLAFVALWAGGLGFWLVLSVAGILMIGEWAMLMGADERHKRLAQYALSVPLAIMAPGLAAGPGFLALGLIVGAAFFLAAVTRNPRLAGGALYVGLPVLALLVLREQPQGLLLTFWAMALVWACDSGAFFAGRAIGGPKLAPAISPNKTWAGFLGGLLAAAVFAYILVALCGLPILLAVATPGLAILAQLGDLYESNLKRRAGVKDSGNLLPGHGGVMDRLDGLVAVAPIAALLVLALPR